MSTHDTTTSLQSIESLEAFQVLRSRASGKLGKLPADLVAHHVLSVTADADWPVQRAAMEAIVRRYSFAHRDGLEVALRPRGSVGLGVYETRRRRDGSRPYRTLLAAVNPLVGSCSCKDFQTGGLGLCKHLLVVLEDLLKKPKKWERATAVGLGHANRESRLVWDPVRPFTGRGDWLERVVWRPSTVDRESSVPAVVARWFVETSSGAWTPGDGVSRDDRSRLQLVGALREFLEQQELRAAAIGHDPALDPLLAAELKRLQLKLDGDVLCAELRPPLKTIKRPLYPYQSEGLTRFLASGRLLLADDMGLGKTVQAIAACHVLWHLGKVRRGLLIVPATLKSQWAREWALFSDVPLRVVDGSPAQREEAYRENDQGFLIANYEQVLRDLALMYRWAPDMIVLDEAQRIKNWATKTAAYVKQLQPRYRLVLTGTPMENRLGELASVMDWVDERALEPKWRLTPWHATLCDGTREISGARNLDTLRIRLGDAMVRRVRQEVIDQLPSRTDIRVPVGLTPAQYNEHEDLKRPIASLLSRARKRPLTQAEFLKLMQLLTTQRMICNGLAQVQFEEVWPTLSAARKPQEAVLRSLDSPKLLEVRELVRQLVLASGQKVVIFSQWRRMLRLVSWAVSDLLAESGLRSAFFSGDESQKRRTQNIIEFHDDPTLAVLLSTDAGGVGLNLQRAASTVINLELPWNPAVLEQRIGRVYRLGQKQPVQVYNLVSEQGIEARIANIVSDKHALFAGLFDGTSNEVRFTGSGRFLDTVERLFDPDPAPTQDLGEPEEPIDEVMPLDDGDVQLTAAPAAASVQAPTPAQPSPPVDGPTVRGPREAPELPQIRGQEIQKLLGSIQVQRTERGGLKIEAPPEAAGALAAMFQGMANLLAGAARPSPAE